MTSQGFKNLNLPEKPGVYFFLGTPKRGGGDPKQKDILYIGKATSLRDRVRSYFGPDLINTRGPLLVDMVWKSSDIKWTETDSVLEALILEATLIKKHQPYYNTKEKDDKSFSYICITNEELPRIFIVRGKNLNKENYSKVYGPFPNGGQLRIALELVRRIFPFLDEKSKVKGVYEFYRQIKLAPEQKEILLKNIKNIKLFFEGKKKSILKSLEKEMKAYAKQKQFEKAGEIKRQIFALNHINDVALIKGDHSTSVSTFAFRHSHSVLEGQAPSGRSEDSSKQMSQHQDIFRIEAYDVAHMSGKNMVGVMTVIEDGEVNKSEYKKFKIKTQTGANDTGALAEVLERRFGHPEWGSPDLIVVDGGRAQINSTEKVLNKLNLSIPVISVLKDERHRPKNILSSPRSDLKGSRGTTSKELARKYEREILLVNSEAHRFAIGYHKQMRNKNFLKK